MLLREYISQTGRVPPGLEIIRDVTDFKPLEIKRTTARNPLSEGKGDKNTPVINIMRCTGVFQKADEKNANGRIYPHDIIKEAVSKLQKPIKERKIVGEYDHSCFTDPNFLVLTVNGWKEFKDIKVGEKVFSRVKGRMVESIVQNIIDEPYQGNVYHLNGKYIDVTVTPEHKFLLDNRIDYIPSDDIYQNITYINNNRAQFNKHRIPRTASWVGKQCDQYVIPGIPADKLEISEKRFKNYITDDLIIDTKTFVSFLGLWLAEGCISSKNIDGYNIFISQVKEDYKPLIREMLSNFPSGLKWNESDIYFQLSDRRLYEYLQKLGNKYTKYIPEDIKQLDAPYLEELVFWFQIGDGRLKHDRSNVFTVSNRLIRDLHECYVKTGGCCYFTTIIPKDVYIRGRLIKAEDSKPLHQLTLSETSGIYLDDRFLKIEKEQFSGRKYCLTVEHGNFYMEYKGRSFWTGNCDSKIHLDRVSHLVTKLWMEGKTVLGEMEVINDDRSPCGSMLACMLDRGIQVGISSRGVGDMELVEYEGEDAYQVQEGFEFISFDCVQEPSVYGTQINKLNESKERLLKKDRKQLIKQAKEVILAREIRRYLGSI